MKYFFSVLFALFISGSLFSQSFNTGEILKPNNFSAGINPVIMNNTVGVYFHGGYGIAKQVDLALKYGIFQDYKYIGADLEWGLRSNNRMNLSLLTGAHSGSYFGLDLGIAVSFLISGNATLFTGVDSDFNFNLNNDRFFWLPLGIEVKWRRAVSIILEADVPLVDFAPGIFGGGMAFYF